MLYRISQYPFACGVFNAGAFLFKWFGYVFTSLKCYGGGFAPLSDCPTPVRV